MLKSKRVAIVTVVAVIASLGVGACGSSSKDASSTKENGAIKPTEEGSAATIATKAGEKLGKESGKPVALPKITVGYIDQEGEAEISERTYAGFEEAIKVLGWKVDHCNAKGIPAQMTACAETLLNEHVNAIIGTAMSPTLFKTQLARARREKIPWVSTEDAVEDPQEYTAEVAPNDLAISKVISDYVVEKLQGRTGTQEISLQTYSAIYGVQNREKALKEAIAGKDIKIVNVHQTNLEATEEDTKKAVTDVLQQKPKLAVIFTTIDNQLPGAAEALRERGLAGKPFPQRPLLVGFFGDKRNLQDIREGLADAVVEVPLEVNSWAAVDQLAQYFAFKATMKNTMLPGAYPLELAPPVLVTKENLPPEGEYVKPKQDYVAFFTSRWKTEFTNVK